MSPRDKKCI